MGQIKTYIWIILLSLSNILKKIKFCTWHLSRIQKNENLILKKKKLRPLPNTKPNPNWTPLWNMTEHLTKVQIDLKDYKSVR